MPHGRRKAPDWLSSHVRPVGWLSGWAVMLIYLTAVSSLTPFLVLARQAL